MRSALGLLRVLVLPVGALTGPRIVLNGIAGEIQVYDLAGLLYADITPSGGFRVLNPGGSGAYVALTLLGGDPVLLLNTGDVDDDGTGRLQLDTIGAGAGRNAVLDLTTPVLDLGNRARLHLQGASADGTTDPAVVLLDADQYRFGSSVASSVQQGQGVDPADEFDSAASSAAFASGATTDFTMTRDMVNGARYRANFASLADASATGTWRANLVETAGGTIIDRFWQRLLTTGAANLQTVEAAKRFTWTGATGSTTFDVRLINVAGGGTLTFTAAATARRQFSIEHVGGP